MDLIIEDSENTKQHPACFCHPAGYLRWLKSIGRTQVVPFSNKEALEVRINHRLQTDQYQKRD